MKDVDEQHFVQNLVSLQYKRLFLSSFFLISHNKILISAVQMSGYTCYQWNCSLNCCNYWGNCPTLSGPPSSTECAYYYYNIWAFWWIYFVIVMGSLICCGAIIGCCVCICRRRRLNSEVVVVENNMPSVGNDVTMGQPMYM